MEKFELGNVVIMESISTRMKEDKHFDIFVKCSLGRYKNCDWGILCAEDKMAADDAVASGHMIMGAYKYKDEEIWIITEWDRSVTTILFPHER